MAREPSFSSSGDDLEIIEHGVESSYQSVGPSLDYSMVPLMPVDDDTLTDDQDNELSASCDTTPPDEITEMLRSQQHTISLMEKHVREFATLQECVKTINTLESKVDELSKNNLKLKRKLKAACVQLGALEKAVHSIKLNEKREITDEAPNDARESANFVGNNTTTNGGWWRRNALIFLMAVAAVAICSARIPLTNNDSVGQLPIPAVQVIITNHCAFDVDIDGELLTKGHNMTTDLNVDGIIVTKEGGRTMASWMLSIDILDDTYNEVDSNILIAKGVTIKSGGGERNWRAASFSLSRIFSGSIGNDGVRNPIPPSLHFTSSLTGRDGKRVCEIKRRLHRKIVNIPLACDKGDACYYNYLFPKAKN